MKMAVTEKNMGNAVKFNAYLRCFAITLAHTHSHTLDTQTNPNQKTHMQLPKTEQTNALTPSNAPPPTLTLAHPLTYTAKRSTETQQVQKHIKAQKYEQSPLGSLLSLLCVCVCVCFVSRPWTLQLIVLRAVNAIKTHPHPLKSGSEAMQLPGVGKKIAQKIQEILETGKLESTYQRSRVIVRVYGYRER